MVLFLVSDNNSTRPGQVSMVPSDAAVPAEGARPEDRDRTTGFMDASATRVPAQCLKLEQKEPRDDQRANS
jgi:hypothetical protein